MNIFVNTLTKIMVMMDKFGMENSILNKFVNSAGVVYLLLLGNEPPERIN